MWLVELLYEAGPCDRAAERSFVTDKSPQLRSYPTSSDPISILLKFSLSIISPWDFVSVFASIFFNQNRLSDEAQYIAREARSLGKFRCLFTLLVYSTRRQTEDIHDLKGSPHVSILST